MGSCTCLYVHVAVDVEKLRFKLRYVLMLIFSFFLFVTDRLLYSKLAQA